MTTRVLLVLLVVGQGLTLLGLLAIGRLCQAIGRVVARLGLAVISQQGGFNNLPAELLEAFQAYLRQRERRGVVDL